MADKVSLDDISLKRDSNGDLVPVTVYVEELGGEITARPMTKSARQRYLAPLADEEDAGELSNEMLAGLFSEHIVEPDMNGVDAEFIENNLNPSAEHGLFFGVLLASGEEEVVEEFRKALNGELAEDEDSEGNQ